MHVMVLNHHMHCISQYMRVINARDGSEPSHALFTRVINARDGSEPSHALFTRVINACDGSEPSHALFRRVINAWTITCTVFLNL
jgi:hypothetical protein